MKVEINLQVGRWYTNEDGFSLKVIGTGTQGIVVEYLDGSAELIDRQTWKDLDMEVDSAFQATTNALFSRSSHGPY